MTTFTVKERPAASRDISDPTVVRDISKAAAKIRISWLVRRDLTVTKVKKSFFAAADLIPSDVVDPRLSDVRDDLYAISEGRIEPREGSFKRQAIAASAKLNNLLTDLTEGANK